jgi:hypothetical protein
LGTDASIETFQNMMRKYTVKLVGIVLVAIGFIDLYGNVYRPIIQSTHLPIQQYLWLFYAVVFCCLAIYGGIQLFRLQEVGRKLALIVFSWILLVKVITELPRFLSTYLPFSEPANMKYFILLLVSYLVYLLVIVLLLYRKIIELMSINLSLMKRLGKILGFCAPGLGTALTVNFLAGMFLFSLYVFLLMANFGIDSSSAFLNWIGKLIYYLIVWRIFSEMDRYAMLWFEKPAQRKVHPA